MAALLPWKARNRTADYLSFLPMNHVTEGILTTYGAYYLPASVNIYFLEDLKDIQRTLPRLRPTIFFSVPRIYERIWEALERNPVGRRYLALPAGLLTRVLGALLRWQTLRKTGLDRCTVLIDGSASCGESLLKNFRELDIEIHNAYGLTEAPLITLNRLGANRLGTVIAGHPGGMLPLTEKEASSFHSARLPENLYVADASLLPKSLGNPPILTIIAMAKRISNICRN